MRAHGGPTQVNITGPAVALRLDDVQPIALVVHELATNATKYGALKQDGGRLAVSWAQIGQGASDPRLVINWRESGVRMPPDAAERTGFGRQLIQKSLEMTLRARTDLVFEPDGVSCRIDIPINRVTGGTPEAASV